MSPRTRCKSESSARPSEKDHAMPRSTRRTAARPHRRAISVAFDDHGEIVPRRGTLSSMRPSPAGAASPYRSRRSSTWLSRGSSARSVSTKCQYSAAAIRPDVRIAARRELSLSSRNAEAARLPRSLSINDMRRAGKAQLYRTLDRAKSVAAAELGILQSAGDREHRARLHALGAKLDLHPPGQVFLGIHLHLSRGVQEARRHSNLANEESIGVRGYDAAHLRKERRSSA